MRSERDNLDRLDPDRKTGRRVYLQQLRYLKRKEERLERNARDRMIGKQ